MSWLQRIGVKDEWDMIKIVFVVRIRSRVNNKYLKRNMVNISEFDRIYKIARINVNGTNLKDSR